MEGRMDERSDARPDREPSVVDFEDLLALAEDLQKERDRQRGTLERYTQRRLILTYTLITLLTAGVLFTVLGDSSATQIAFYALITGFLAAVAIYVMMYELRRLESIRHDLKATDRALYEAVGILRETEDVFSDEWPILRKAQFRIRLSRFGIGPDDAWYEPSKRSKI